MLELRVDNPIHAIVRHLRHLGDYLLPKGMGTPYKRYLNGVYQLIATLGKLLWPKLNYGIHLVNFSLSSPIYFYFACGFAV